MTSKLQFILTIAIATHLITYGLSWAIGIGYFVIFPVALCVIGFLGGVLWRWSTAQWVNSEGRKMGQAINKIKNLSLEEAKKKAHELLNDTTKFKCVKAHRELQQQYQLSSSLQEFFSTYESVETVAGEARLGRDQIGLSHYQKSFLRLGTDSDFTEIAICPSEDCVYEIDGSEVSEDDFEHSRLPSIYHWVLVTSEVLYGGNDANGKDEN